MSHVDVYIDATASNYWALLQVEKDGVTFEKKLKTDRDGTVNGNLIAAVTESFRALNRPCMVDVYTRSEYIVEPFKNGWIQRWEKNEWKNAKGKEVRNAALWKELREAMARHSVRFILLEGKR